MDPSNSDVIKSIKHTRKKISELYPILFSKDGELLDGNLRAATGKWNKKEILENVTTNIEKIIVKFASNYRRRTRSTERKELINELAGELIKEGIAKPDPDSGGPAHLRNRPIVTPLIAEILGISEFMVMHHLKDKYKRGHGVKLKKLSKESVKKRSLIALKADLLKQLYKNKERGLKRTVLMYKSNTSWSPLLKNLRILVENGLVDEDNFLYYHITVKGMKILAAYEYAEYYLQEIDKVSEKHKRGFYLEERLRTGLS